MTLIKKIVILGPESTGKTSLCKQLADHYKTTCVPEYAREYLQKHGMSYTYDDLLTIAQRQYELEEKQVEELTGRLTKKPNGAHQVSAAAGRGQSELLDQHTPVFVDTDMHVMKVWCEFVFGKCHDWILDKIAETTYDLYFICNIDIPWVNEALREYPDLESRQKLFHIYKDMMVNQAVPWVEINGDYDQRIRKAITAVDELLVTG